jgi:hydrogenase maturation protein HypF
MATRVQIQVRGLVQGVGFRPFVFSLAGRLALRGRVFNNGDGVLIDVEGDGRAIERFIAEVESSPPRLSVIESVERFDDLEPANYRDFRIIESASSGEKFAPVPADVATCDDCLRELFDPSDRRYRYPFINCANCGPRFTIIEDIPYDRAKTTMREFAMCRDCRVEYENPLDRRFHAEPIACPHCGPRLFLAPARGRGTALDPVDGEDVIYQASLLLSEGRIIAVKGVGGFHLACDALNADAVERLRRRKYREDKPFAMMAGSVEVIKQYCAVSEAEEGLLLSSRRPIVLLERRPGAVIPPAVAPGVTTLGFMLPYAPLSYLLLQNFDRPLIMTSGNLSDEPICYEDQDAIDRLSRIADHLLLHNRRIHIRSDDSLARAQGGRETILRRSRGYAPEPIKTGFEFSLEILACGAELKNTFCFARGRDVFLSHHIGDLENLETLQSFQKGIDHFKHLFGLRPEVIAHDLHPDYISTKYAVALDDELTKVGVQHHHAHIASCMVDNRIEGEVIGVAMDGLGFGEDGRLWGGEFFIADFAHAERVAHLDYVPMPGGTRAIREPWRMAAIYLHRVFGDDFLDLKLPFVKRLDKRAWAALRKMVVSGVNSPETSSMGRLFDAVASMVGMRTMINYEGQAAVELEAIADRSVTRGYEFEITSAGVIKAEHVILRAAEDLLADVSPQAVSARFHLGVAGMIVSIALRLRAERRLNRVVLSGGVFQNMYLLAEVCRSLESNGFDVFTHRRTPANDGGVSLGQAAVANARLVAGRS